MRQAARLLLVEEAALRPILDATDPDLFDAPTVCTGWSVRDILAHCGAALSMTAADDLHAFTPEENQHDVDERRRWALDDVLAELYRGYRDAAAAIDRAGGELDGIGLGEWMHGGDVREAIGAPRPYTSEGADMAFELLLARSERLGISLDVDVAGRRGHFGSPRSAGGSLTTDLETFVRLTGGRRPDPDRYDVAGASPAELILFN